MSDPAPSRSSRFFIPFLLLLFVIGGSALWWLSRDGGAGGDEEEVASVESSSADLARKKHQARASAAPATPVGLFGRITRSEDDTGVAGAVVMLNRRAMYQGASTQAGRPSELLKAVTDDKGDWRIDRVPTGRYAISASARGLAPASNNALEVRSAQQDQEVNLAMDPGGLSLSGTVKDIGGGPIENVFVRVDSIEGINFMGMNHPPLAALSDEEGHYELFVDKGRYVMTPSHEDYVGTPRMTQVSDGRRVENLEMTPAGAIEGVVLSKLDGKPIAGAQVIFQDARSAAAGITYRTNMSSDGRLVISDENGKFALSGLSPGLVRVDARADHHAATELVDVPLGIGETVSGVEVLMDSAFKVSGFVVPKGDPESAIEGVVVGAYTMGPFTLLASSEPSGPEGYFEIKGLLPGGYTIGAISHDAIPTIAGASITLKDADIDDLIVELDTGVHVKGRVEPPEIASVDLEVEMETMGFGTMMDMFGVAFAGDKSLPTGEFDLGPVKPGTYKLVAKGRSGASLSFEITVPEDGLEDVVVQLEPRAMLAGRVIDEAGVPVSGLSISLTPQEEGSLNVSVMVRTGGLGEGFVTEEDGSYRATGFEAGEYLLSVTDSRRRRLDLSEGQEDLIAFTEGEQREGYEIVVVAKNAEISGVVLDADGLPIADVFVTASLDVSAKEFGKMIGPARPRKDKKPRHKGVTPEDDDDDEKPFEMPAYFSEQPVLTDQAGNFLIKGIQSGRKYVVVAEGDRGASKARERGVEAGARITLQLEALGSVSGTVKGAKKLASYTVKLEGPSKREKRVHETADGFTFERLEAGEYIVRLEADEGVAKEELTLEGSATVKIELELEPYAKISGTLVNALDGEEIGGAIVMLVPSDGDVDPKEAMAMMMGGGSKTDRSGEFELSKVKPGKGMVVFMDGNASFAQMGGAMAWAKYEVEGGDELDLGEVKGTTTPEEDEESEKGELGFSSSPASFKERPRPMGTDLDEEEESEMDDDPRLRLWVSWVEIGGPADDGGLLPGDEILKIDGRSVQELSAPAADNMLSPGRIVAGQEVELVIDRQGSSETVRIKAVAHEE